MMRETSQTPPLTGTLYTLGYAQQEAPAQLDRLMRDCQTLLLDIRYRPRSRWFPQWNQSALLGRYGDQYVWDQRLGNLNYQHRELDIQLAPGHSEAIIEAAHLLLSGVSLVLLCACRDPRACHRSLVAKLIQGAVDQIRQKGSLS